MKENFDRSFYLLMEFEGIYSDDPDDTGGKTLYGITQNNFPKEFEEISKIKTPEYRLAYAKDFYKKRSSGTRQGVMTCRINLTP